MDSRDINVKHLKLYLPSIHVYGVCLHCIDIGDVKYEENDILSTILGNISFPFQIILYILWKCYTLTKNNTYLKSGSAIFSNSLTHGTIISVLSRRDAHSSHFPVVAQ